MRPKFEDMAAMVREYCEVNGLDPAVTSVTFNAAYEITGHLYAPSLGFPVPCRECCCGVEGCDGGLAERLAEWGIDPAEVTEVRGTIPLGAVDCE
jgi:hypothetical protein